MENGRIHLLLVNIYGEERSAFLYGRLQQLLDKYRSRLPKTDIQDLSERDSILITYPDQVQETNRPPLESLTEFCVSHFRDVITGIHILPFYPWSSDDGFSVIDYRAVDPQYGDWDDIRELGKHFQLMFDAVINHVSIQSEWFQGFLNGDKRYLDYFITVDGNPDLSLVVRPRTLPLLTTVETKVGERNVWTTFSSDQVDLNYQNPEVLFEIIDILLFYVSQGARFIRLDAIAYMWKEIGTLSIHLPQTHWIIQLFRAVLDEVAPQVMLITETNVPHADNISYFGNGSDEAQMVYNFSLPPLVLHAFQTGSAEKLSRWAESLQLPSKKVTFFNFLSSHDGIGLNPLRDILSEQEIEEVVDRVQAHGGLVSFKSESDGTKRPYELNINYFDALNDPASDEPMDLQIERFVTAHAILLAMVGLPAIYFHSLFGSRGWPEGVAQTGRNRTVNRQKFRRADLEARLMDPSSREAQVLNRLSRLFKVRASYSAFHPYGSQNVLHLAPGLFSLSRSSPDGKNRVICLHNVSERTVVLDSQNSRVFEQFSEQPVDIISGDKIQPDSTLSIQPYHSLWIK
jgi:glycosidase